MVVNMMKYIGAETLKILIIFPRLNSKAYETNLYFYETSFILLISNTLKTI